MLSRHVRIGEWAPMAAQAATSYGCSGDNEVLVGMASRYDDADKRRV